MFVYIYSTPSPVILAQKMAQPSTTYLQHKQF